MAYRPFDKVKRVKNRFFVLALSILVLIVTLAGLRGILSILPRGQLPASVLVQPTDEVSGDILTNVIIPSGGERQPQAPLFVVTGAATTSLLRGRADSYYDGEVWRRRDNAEYYIYEGETLSPPVTSYNRRLVDDIIVESLIELPTGAVPILTSLHTVHVSSDLPLLHFPEERVFHSKEGFPDAYAFRAAHYDFDDSVLLDAEIDPRDIYLQLPAAITQRTRELALAISKDSDSPYRKVRAIESYLKANYVYCFEYHNAPDGWEPNDWFLFEEKRGVCTNFNSAFVVLSRSVGIPTRLISGFAITPQEEKQVVFTDQAHAWAEVKFKGVGWHTFDATGSLPDLLPTITRKTPVAPVVKKGHTFSVQGSVRTEDGSPVDGLWVNVVISYKKGIEGGLLIGGGITSEGYFDIEVVIPAEVAVGDYYVTAHCPGSIRYLGSWSNSIIRVVTATDISLQVPSRVKVQEPIPIIEPIMIKGNLREEFGQPLVGQPVNIYLADKKVAELTTVEDGYFVWEQILNDAGAYTVKASFVGTDYYLESNHEVEFQVLTPTKIELDVISPDAAAGATAGEQVLIVGSLFETITNMPLQGQEIEMPIDGGSAEDKIVTDGEGSFEIKHTFDEAGHYQIEARFSSIPFYWESSTIINLEVFPSPYGFPWLYLIIVLTLALAGIAGFVIYWRHKQRYPLLASATAQGTPKTQDIPLYQRGSPGREISLAIELPQIKSPFPDVWGVSDDLEIVCHLSGPQGDRFAGRPLGVYVDNELITQLTTDQRGTAKLYYTFFGKGQYDLLVRFKEEFSAKDISVRRRLRIVDYREEIISLFEALANWFRDLGIELSVELTPREMGYRVLHAIENILGEDMEKVVSCFEEADYSLHPISRSSYEAMYLGQEEIRKHGE